MKLNKILYLGITCLFILGYAGCGEKDKKEISININGETEDNQDLEKEQSEEENSTKDNEEKQVLDNTKDREDIIVAGEKIVSYKTYLHCSYNDYGVYEKTVTGKKSEIINPKAILKELDDNGFTIPDGTKVNSFRINENDIGYLDLTEHMNSTVAGVTGEEIRNSVLANTFMSAYDINGLVININGSHFEGGGHGSYEINQQLGAQLEIHEPNHKIEGNQEDKPTEEVINTHTKEEVYKAKKLLENEFIPQGMVGFEYEDGSNEFAKPYMEKYILFNGIGANDEGYDRIWGVERQTNEIFYIYSDGKIIKYEKEESNNLSYAHTQEEIDRARKVLEKTFNDDQRQFIYMEEAGANVSKYLKDYIPFHNEFLDGTASDHAATVKKGTDDVYIIFSDGRILTYLEYLESVN